MLEKMMSIENRKFETKCGRVIWESRSVAVCAHVYAEVDGVTYVAVLRRGEKMDNGGLWCMPCGYLDWDESAEQGARREVMEELGIELGGLELIRVDDSPEAYKQNITFAYRAWVDELLELHCDGAAVGEVQDLKWMKVSEVEEHEWAFEHGVMIQRDLMGEFEGRI